MKVLIKRVEKVRDVANMSTLLVMQAEVTAFELAAKEPMDNALQYLHDAQQPVDVHIAPLELVRAMSTEDLERLLVEITSELDDRG